MSRIIMMTTLFEFTLVFISHKLCMLHRPQNTRFRCHVSCE